jgi:hypothetical protein
MTRASPHPSEGAKLLLERARVSDDGQRADYLASIYTPDHRYDFDASLCTDGTAELVARGEAPEASLEKALANIAKSTARAAKRKQGEGLPPWPHRVHRWRGPGRG